MNLQVLEAAEVDDDDVGRSYAVRALNELYAAVAALKSILESDNACVPQPLDLYSLNIT